MHPLAGTAARVTLQRSVMASATRTAIPRMAMRQHLHSPRMAVSSASSATRRSYSTSPPPPPPASNNDTNKPHEAPDAPDAPSTGNSLPSTAESRRSALTSKFSAAMDRLQARALTASQTLNDVTGYSAIEAIKADNEATEAALEGAQERVRAARTAYRTSNTQRAATQREVTALLARKDSWTPGDLERFTELYRADHALEGGVGAAQEALTAAEAAEQALGQRLRAGILKRYHEEQIWSDRIRRASTWGTWGLMGMNFVLFVLLQFFAEPWRRRRLVRGVVEHERDVLDGVRAEMEALRAGVERTVGEALQAGKEETLAAAAAEKEAQVTTVPPVLAWQTTTTTWREFLQDPARWKAAAADLCSERHIDLRMKDATTLVLQGAVAGAAVVGGIAVLAGR